MTTPKSGCSSTTRLSSLGCLVIACAPPAPASQGPGEDPGADHGRIVAEDRADLASPSVSRAAQHLERAASSSGWEAQRELSLARAHLERVTHATAAEVRVDADGKSAAAGFESVSSLPGTPFWVGGTSTRAVAHGVIVRSGDEWSLWNPEPLALDGRSRGPLVVSASGRYALTGAAAGATLLDLEQGRGIYEASGDETPFFSSAGEPRLAMTDAMGARLLSLPEKLVLFADHGGTVVVDHDAGLVASYRAAFSTGPGPVDAELRVYDSQDGRLIAESSSPPVDFYAPPQFALDPGRRALAVLTSHDASVFSFATERWSSVGTFTSELLGGGAFGVAYDEGGRLCAAWQDQFHIVPKDTPKGAYPVCTFEDRDDSLQPRARIGCVESERGWVRTASSARPVSIRGAAFAASADRVAVLENAAGVDPLPGGLVVGPPVHVRVVLADPKTCKIEQRVDLGVRVISNGAELRVAADVRSFDLDGESFQVSGGPAPPKSARDSEKTLRCRFGQLLGPPELCRRPPPALDSK